MIVIEERERVMYGRGVRLLTQPALSTAPGVGPGTYRLDYDRAHTTGLSVCALYIIIVCASISKS